MIVNDCGQLVAFYFTAGNVDNFMVNLVGGLIAYTWQPNKPSLNLTNEDAPFLSVLIQFRTQVSYCGHVGRWYLEWCRP